VILAMMQHIHILGICGTFMGSLAQLAVAKGFKVTGCDANVYPPMSTQLENAGIELIEGFSAEQLSLKPDVFIIGNAMSRGNKLVEAILDAGLPYISGPQWLHDKVLQGKWVLAVAGTHGKTTTSSMLTWILEYANMEPGYLIGGVPSNFDVSARLGSTPFFVIEADEYDSAFFDKRSKFVHYQPRTLIINNLEFDHADIFDELKDIQKQFHHLVRTVPKNGLVIHPSDSHAVDEVIAKGCWTPLQSFTVGHQALSLTASDAETSITEKSNGETSIDYDSTSKSSTNSNSDNWSVELLENDGSHFNVFFESQQLASVRWSQLGRHNIANAMVAIAAARHVGVTPEVSAEALATFTGVKRRMECLYSAQGISIYDDFAHHPTAIATTLDGLRAKVGLEKIIVLIEPRSNTMRMGVHQGLLAESFECADQVLWFSPESITWDIEAVIDQTRVPAKQYNSIASMIGAAINSYQTSTTPVHVVIMSNGSFEGIHQKLIDAL
jgi:UDP-N-acetylmuramate: L-alanyl-gamma-D-glutamyl-meso-diaminopimelate ligase